MWQTPFIRLLIFFVAYLWFKSFSGAVLPTHFLKQGLSFKAMAAGGVFFFLGQIIVLLTIKKLSAKASWFLALLTSATFLLLVIRIFSPAQYYLASAISGTALFFYFVFYNIAYFENTPKEKIGRHSALMFTLPMVINIIAPLLAGYLAQISFNLIWLVSFFSFLPPLFLIFYQKDFEIAYTIKGAISEIQKTRVFIFLEGVWEAMVFGVIPIYTLYFLKTPLSYGTYLTYLSLVAVVANLTLGKLTDKLQKRVVFLYPLTTVLAVITLLFPITQKSLGWWLILTGAIQFLLPLFWNVTTAMVMDTHPNLRLAIPGRELILAIGRFIGLSLTFISFTFEKTPFLLYFILGGVLLLFPLNLYWNRRVKKYTYL